MWSGQTAASAGLCCRPEGGTRGVRLASDGQHIKGQSIPAVESALRWILSVKSCRPTFSALLSPWPPACLPCFTWTSSRLLCCFVYLHGSATARRALHPPPSPSSQEAASGRRGPEPPRWPQTVVSSPTCLSAPLPTLHTTTSASRPSLLPSASIRRQAGSERQHTGGRAPAAGPWP